MTIRPGRSLIVAALALACAAPLTFFVPASAWILLAATSLLIVMAVQDRVALKAQLSALQVTRELPPVVGRGTTFVSRIAITGDGAAAIEGVVRDVRPGIAEPDFNLLKFTLDPAGGQTTLDSQVCIGRRGRFEFGPIWIRLRGRRSMLEAQQSFDCPGRVRVLPETFASDEGLSKDQRAELMLLDKVTRTRQHGPGTDFESLSEFRQGDDPRRIDWRTTARFGRPIVRRYQIERHRDIFIVVDCGRLMGADTGSGTKLDCAVDSALMLARVALQNGDRCGIGVFDDRVRGFLSPVSGIASLNSLADNVYDLQSLLRESDFGVMFAELQARQPRRSLIVILSDLVDMETSTRFRTSLYRLARRHVVLFAALQTPLLTRVIQSPVETMLDGSRKAVTFRLLRDRERAVHSVRRSGVHVLDIEPSQLTVPLLNQFIELRRSDLL